MHEEKYGNVLKSAPLSGDTVPRHTATLSEISNRSRWIGGDSRVLISQCNRTCLPADAVNSV